MPSVFRPHYWRTDPKTGKKTRKRYKTYRVKYRIAPGVHKTVAGYRDREASVEKGRKLEQRAAREREGIYDPFEEHEGTELAEHLRWFQKHLEARGNADGHIKPTIGRIKAIVAACDFTTISRISASKVDDYLARCRRAKDFGATTSNYYLTAIKSFCRWLVLDRRTAINPLIHLRAITTDGKLSRVRRAATPQQFAKLITAARKSTNRRQLPGTDRAVVYMVAAYTGFRAAELASLTPESFDLDHRSVTVEAGYSKRRRRDTQPHDESHG